VYEIYKAGRDPHWADGMDLLAEFGLELAVVPHFDDNSGGDHYDSRFCYMGATRFDALQALLPPDVAILGIDEYTTVTFVPGAAGAVVGGQGGATVLADGERNAWRSGETIPWERLRSTRRAVVPSERRDPTTLGYEYAEEDQGTAATDNLADFVAGLALEETDKVELLARVESGLRVATAGAAQAHAPELVDLALELRTALRGAKVWDMADRARQRLEALGYRVADTPDGSTWSRG
jgi:hypothetical protein